MRAHSQRSPAMQYRRTVPLRLSALALAAAFWWTGHAALAQEEGAEATEEAEQAEEEATEEPPAGAEEMFITARKREENLQESPLAVTGFSGDTLEDLGIAQTDDVTSLAPNVYLTQTPGSAANIGVTIRGIGGAEPALTRDTGVALYVDGAYIARTAGAVFDLVDLQRVEVLRGPQGTLYGRNATGGAVNFISRQPLEEFGFEQTLGYGNFDFMTSRTTIDTGLIEETGLSATFTYLMKNRDGYVNDRNAGDGSDPGAYDTDAFRIALNWAPMEMFTASYAFDYSDMTGQDPYFQLVGIDPAVLAALDASSTIPETDDDRLSLVNEDFHKASTHRINGHNLTLEYDFEITTMKLITTYREWDNTEEGTELDGNAGLVANTFGGPVPFQLFAATNEREQDQFSQEMQLYGPVGERVDYVTGVYFFQESFDEYNPQTFLVTSLANPLIPPGFGVIVTPDPLTGASILDYDGDAESWAVYTDWSWTPPILEDRLKLSAGVRYSEDEKSISQRANPPSLTVNRSAEEDWNAVDWQATTSYQFTDAVMSYVRVATAYKAGGFNPRSAQEADPTQLTPFDEETVLTYELGTKTQLFDDRLTLNGAIFYSDYDDLQVDQFTAGSGGAASETVNAGKAHIWGIEVEAFAQLTDHISSYLNYGWLDMEYDEFKIRDPATNLIFDDAEDAKFGYRPQQTLAAGLAFESDPLGSCGAVLGSRLDVNYVDDIWWGITDFAPSGAPINPFRDELKEGGYTLLHANVSIGEIPIGSESRLKFTLWGRNLLDEEYRRSGIDFGALGFGGVIYGEPRTYGATMTFSY
jgi:iron complex outermembrane receptor protein